MKTVLVSFVIILGLCLAARYDDPIARVIGYVIFLVGLDWRFQRRP